MTAELVAPSRKASSYACVLMLCGLAIYGRLVVMAQRLSREHFDPTHHHRLFGWPLSLAFKRTDHSGE